ncbi:histone-lysine N-methyltransferase, H3 lysine-9 specific SUVH6-like [Magnolia sinica]|uniref:histone-lysine N-methyltransferase, H3 lysine-9 specific SUVH6-like n=1 Tax=Magnolia sinica TaxID=86752 RepID=UPI0026596103|nr:histone-lysine N-methyltransferase, H3 lysine-9 specific SUVH6-like [Magnolia sinica]
MAESVNNSNQAKPELLSNGHVVEHPLKYKRRKVSAVRDFPFGCGRFAPKINQAQKESSVAAVEVESSGGFVGAVDSESLEPLKCLDQNGLPKTAESELLESAKALEPKIMELQKSSDQAELVKLAEASIPKTVEVLNSPGERKLVGTSENLKPETSESLKSLAPETVELPKSLGQLESLDVVGSSCQPEQMEILSISGQIEPLRSPKGSVHPGPKISVQIQSSTSVAEPVEERQYKKYPPRRRISAIRDFPPGCGRNAPRMSKEECMKLVALSGSKSMDNEKVVESPSNGMVGTVKTEDIDGKLKGNDTKQIGEKIQVGDVIESKSKGSVSNEIDGIVKGKSVSKSNTFEDGAQDIIDNIQVKAASGSKLEGKDTKEISEKVKIIAGHETASRGKLKVEDPEEITEEIRIRAVAREAASGGKSKVENTKEIAEEVHIKAVAHEAASKSKLNGEHAKEITKNVQSRAAHETPSGSKLKGKHAKEITEKVEIRAAHETASGSKSKREGTKEITEKLHNTAAHENKLSRSGTPSQSVNEKVRKEVGSSAAKTGKESMRESKDKSSKRKLMAEPEEENAVENQSQREQTTGSELPSGRVIVQALMAAPNCPWRQGKRPSKHMLSSRSSGGRNKPTSVFKKKEDGSSSRNSESSEGRMAKKKSPPTGNAASQCKEIVNYDEDSLPYDDEEEDESIPLGQEVSLSVIPFGLPSASDKSARNKVRETLRLFQAICRKLLQEEEAKSKEQGQTTKRIDLTASTLLKAKNKWVNAGEVILGNVPGVEIGDEFRYRVELAIIGLHRLFQSGIDYTKRGGMIVATSIVASAGYADDTDGTDVLIYSGQGGNPRGGDKQPEDQKLERGNLALKNSIDSETPVRVIRGFKEHKGNDSQDTRGRTVTTFTYDGLYMVEKYWRQAHHGLLVFKFQLRRIPGQPELAVKEVKKSKKSTVREGLCVVDISEGKEKIPICAVNTIDDKRPPQFNYITKMIYPSWYDPIPPRGCECSDGCLDSEKCFCAVKNGGEIPFNYNGAIVEAKPLVYECGPSCKCPPSCYNRVSQHGIRFQLEIFKTKLRGWGVRSLTSIPSGSFICEYTGELLQDKEAEQRTGNDEYLFDIGHNYSDHSLWDGLSNLIPDLQSNASCEVVEDVGFTIDAAQHGSVGRFINHSCSPNLYAQNVLYDHDDKRMPHIMFFAAENIPPLQELTYHYNYTIDQVRDSDGNIKKKNCYCGSHECTGRLY